MIWLTLISASAILVAAVVLLIERRGDPQLLEREYGTQNPPRTPARR